MQEKESKKYTWLNCCSINDFPEGWRKAFAEQMCEEIQTALEKISAKHRNNF